MAGVLTWTGTTNDYRKLYVDGGDYTDEDSTSTTIANTDLTEIDLNRSIDASGYTYSSNVVNAAEAAIWRTSFSV